MIRRLALGLIGVFALALVMAAVSLIPHGASPPTSAQVENASLIVAPAVTVYAIHPLSLPAEAVRGTYAVPAVSARIVGPEPIRAESLRITNLNRALLSGGLRASTPRPLLRGRGFL